MRVNKFWLVFLGILVVVSFLVSCTSQPSQEQLSPTSSTTSHKTPTVMPQTAVWGNLTFTVVSSQWKGDTLTLAIRVENKGTVSATFNQVFYAYNDSSASIKMCQGTLNNLWASYGAGDIRNETIYFILPASSSDIWLAIETTKIIEIPYKGVPPLLGARKEVAFSISGGNWAFTLKGIEWLGNRVAIAISIENIGNSADFVFTQDDKTHGRSIFYLSGMTPVGNRFQWYSDWYVGKYESGDIRSGVLYFDVPPCTVDLRLVCRDGNLFEIYR